MRPGTAGSLRAVALPVVMSTVVAAPAMAGAELPAAATAAARLQAYLAIWEVDVLSEHGRDIFDHAPLSFAATYRTVQRYGDDAPSLQAVIVAGSASHWLWLLMHGPTTKPLDDFKRRTRDVASLVQLQPEE